MRRKCVNAVYVRAFVCGTAKKETRSDTNIQTPLLALQFLYLSFSPYFLVFFLFLPFKLLPFTFLPFTASLTFPITFVLSFESAGNIHSHRLITLSISHYKVKSQTSKASD